MAEINNALALGVKPVEFDITKPLEAAAKINSLRASTAQTEQETQYRQFQQDQNQGYRVPEVSTLAGAHEKQLGIAGQIGNMMVQAKTPADRLQAIKAAKDHGIQINPLVEQHLLSAPEAQFKQYGKNMQAAGQGATANIEQNPAAIAQRSQSHAGGTELGTMYGPPGGVPTPIQKGAGNPAPAVGAAPAPAPAGLSLQERKLEAAGNAGKRVEEFNQYRQENEGAGVQKVALRQLMQDAERVRTGAGADKEQAARKWLLAAGQLIPGLQGVADKYSDPVAAFESINKNAGLIARTAIKQVGGTAASELDAISKSLVGPETSQKGIMINASQLVGLETYKQARFNAAQQYQDANGSLKGFSAEFNQKAGPAAWVFMSLPAEERAKVAESMRKTPEGKRTLNSVAKQLKYIHDNKLDEGVE